MNSPFITQWRFWLVTVMITIAFTAVLGKLYYLHVWESEALQKIVERNRKRLEIRSARRGNIVDKRGDILATTQPVMVVGVDPEATDPNESADKWVQLAGLLNIPLEEINKSIIPGKRRLKTKHGWEIKKIRWRKLAEGINEAQYEKIRSLGIRGVYGNRQYERVYPHKTLASHLIGFVNKEGTPVIGVEQAMNFYLQGQDGWREIERDGSASRREIVHFRNREVSPTNGLNIELTISSVVQHYVEQEIDRLVNLYDPNGVSIIVSDPKTGHILGLANYPHFDPNDFQDYPIESQRNRALTDQYEPGSIFKVIVASAALNEKRVQSETIFDCSLDKVEYRGRHRRLPSDHHPHKELSFEEVLVQSSNRGAAQIGMLLGEKLLYKYACDFGFGESTELGLIGEEDGQLHPVKRWDGLTITRLPMGHAISATPMQVHCAMSVIANNGILMAPQVVQRIFHQGDDTILSFPPRAKRRVLDFATASKMAAILTRTVLPGGTATKAAISQIEVAGKTGTTQKIVNGKYSSNHHIASFSGFFPASDPQIVMTVVVDEPRLSTVGYGGVIAAPAFKKIGEQLISYLTIQPPSNTDPYIVQKNDPAYAL